MTAKQESILIVDDEETGSFSIGNFLARVINIEEQLASRCA